MPPTVLGQTEAARISKGGSSEGYQSHFSFRLWAGPEKSAQVGEISGSIGVVRRAHGYEGGDQGNKDSKIILRKTVDKGKVEKASGGKNGKIGGKGRERKKERGPEKKKPWNYQAGGDKATGPPRVLQRRWWGKTPMLNNS